MKQENHYQWRTLWLGKWHRTRYHTTEERIRKTNPEAVRIEETLIVRMVPDTPEEKREAMSNTPGAWLYIKP